MPRVPKDPTIIVTDDNAIRLKKAQTAEAVAERKRRFLEVLAEVNGNRKRACEIAGIDRSNLYYWIDSDETFAEAIKRVRRIQNLVKAEDLEETVFGLATGRLTKDEVPHFQAAKFLLEKYDAENFSTTVTHQHTGTVYHTLIPDPASLEEMEIVPLEAEYQLVEDEE